MAETVQSTAVVSGVCPDQNIPAGVLLSRTGTYAAVAALAVNSVIQLIPLPKGAQLVDLFLAWSALGTGVTVDVGITDTDYTGYDIDMFYDGLAAEYAGAAHWGGAMINNAAAAVVHGAKFLAATWPYEFTANGNIDVKVLGDEFPISAVVTGVAFYKFEGGIADE